jgi:hypothetical protein
VGALFDDTEPEDDALLEPAEDIEQSDSFRIYVGEGLNELQDWLREQ